MRKSGLCFTVSIALSLFFITACSTSPMGRRQLMLIPDSQLNAMGATAFSQMKSERPTNNSSSINQYVRCVAVPITEAAKGQLDVDNWEIVVFQDDTANAFALPGGKIGVHTGILKVAKTPDQLAAVLGHEVGHVMAKHGNERVSQGIAAQGGLSIIESFIKGNASQSSTQLIMAGLGAGTQVGMLKFSREHESESDIIGLDLMSRAGFDPAESVKLWENMSAAGGGAPPEWLSTHPSHETRINELRSNMPGAVAKYNQAKSQGQNPRCSM